MIKEQTVTDLVKRRERIWRDCQFFCQCNFLDHFVNVFFFQELKSENSTSGLYRVNYFA